jgi:hypothetical protein
MSAATKLRIGLDGFSLPPEAVTETFAILAKRGAGKTFTSAVMVEEMVKAGLPVVVVDPIGVWWGLRSSADGESPGLPVTILGGEHGDVPLELTAGALVADLVVDAPTPLVLDLSLMRKGEARRFMTDFLEQLYRRNRDPLHVVLDEADEWAPQRPQKGAERLLGACEDLVRRGRARGLGVTLISQRPAVIHKDVLTQTEVLVALRIIGPQDRDAIDAWIKVHGTADERAELLGSLAKLPIGTAWFWSPGWLDVFQMVKVRRRETFDSSATPKMGDRPIRPRALAAVDLHALKERMAETIERAEANDPKALRRRIAQLERDLRDARAATPEPLVEEVEVPVLPDDLLESLAELLTPAGALLSEVRERLADHQPGHVHAPGLAPPAHPTRAAAARPAPVAVAERPRADAASGDAPALAKADRAILTVLAQHPEGRTRTQIALLSGYSIKSSSLANSLGKLRSAGYVTKSGDPVQATAEGVEALGAYEPLPAGQSLYDWWAGRLSRAERAVLDVLANAWPEPVDRDTLAERSGYSATSSSLANALGKLRSLELVDGWAAHDDFMAAVGR